MKRLALCILLLSILASSCSESLAMDFPATLASSQNTQDAMAWQLTSIAEAQKEPRSFATQTIPPYALPSETVQASIMQCRSSGQHVGNSVTCMIQRAYCSYRPDIGGAPTFCNDAPYPTHSFTLLVWGSDWSDYDGQCVIVNGYVSRYEGKPQIVAESRSQVSRCP